VEVNRNILLANMGIRMNDIRVQEPPQARWVATFSADEALAVIGYLVSSAALCLDDPVLYGSFRLLDAANRFLGLLLAKDPVWDDAFLHQLKEQIDQKKDWLMYDQDSYRDFVRGVPVLLAGHLKDRAKAERGSDGTHGDGQSRAGDPHFPDAPPPRHT